MQALDLKITDPHHVLFEGAVVKLTCETRQGQLTILPGHTELIAELSPGEMVVTTNDAQVDIWHVGGGLLKVGITTVEIAADAAEKSHEIEADRAEAALLAAKTRLEQEKLSQREYAFTLSLVERNASRIKIARKHPYSHQKNISSENS